MTSVDKIVMSDTERTFQYNKDLLTLPVPDLSNTLKKYLQSVKPLVTEDEYKKTEFIVQQFASGEGKYLHEKLKEKAKNKRNWLELWWEDAAYLELRLQRPLMNMAGPAPYSLDVWPAEPGSQIPRAALITYYILKFWEMCRKETYRPMKDNKGRPLCMYQFRRIFNTCAVPGVQKDKLVEYFQTDSEGSCPSHLLVMSKGHMYSFDVLDEKGEILTVPELQALLQQIRDHSSTLGPADGINFMTSEERTTWARARSHLVALNPKNYQVIEQIQTSVFALWLEDGYAGDETDLANKSLLGPAENRWFDKSISMGVYENGLFISNADHTPAEGIMMVYVTSYVHLKLRECQGKWQGSSQIRKLKQPELLQFVIDDFLRKEIEAAKKNYAKLSQIATAELRVYSKYGKQYCKEKNVHPDALCQLAMQLAYYRTYRRLAPTYETAPIKQFYHGRTETMRTCTSEVKQWCEAMLDPSAKPQDKLKTFLTALKKHVNDFNEACELKGCDRHLLGLYLVAKEENLPVPMIYQDPSYSKSGGGGNFILSTSCLGFTTVIGGVLPMCENCIGTFYRINDDRLSFYVTTWNADKDTSSPGFADAICNALDSLKELLDVGTTMSKL
ncbi:peroxisomal carnitine O-octanoyltransferase-like [Physella acuta]|uniref:peroxisomal carnitine O-octanoyltransferase-like n=1 Tax=Physella acuta TaxID=109671 RepID=UPI0027DE4D6D|nr:peroxisomal carnitine O-octanoyltransferase-like [Physella acuta]XP_059155407.1 peroxisomal carnitine O-octanoyltransferase-like [Physella acuta]XP_059155408.1 peroxisomal carnitine O-octanoyltransferase-like [Physella acuta]